MHRKSLVGAVAAACLTVVGGAAMFGTASAGIGDDASGDGTVPDTDPAYPPSSDEETTTTATATTVVVTTAPATTAPGSTAAPTTAPASTAPVTTPNPTTAVTEVASGAVTSTSTASVSAGGAVATTTPSASNLPTTGSDSISTVQIGVVTVLTGAGLVAVGATRRKRRRTV